MTTVLPTFKPLPLLSNPHVQTILGNLWKGRLPSFPSQLHRLPLPDGDALAVHDSVAPSWRAGDPIAILVHGLGGCHQSGYMLRLTGRFLERGWRVFRMDLRGVGAGATLARRTYHGGCSHDAAAVVDQVHAWHPSSPLTLIGLSLGGNIVLKLAGEGPRPGLHKVIAVGPPIDLGRCAELLATAGKRWYEKFFIHNLVKQVREHQRVFPDLPPVTFPRRLTMRQFDDLYTAPRNGFADAQDYYRRASAWPVMEGIGLPTYILTARDDPFIAVEPFGQLQGRPHLRVHIQERGGHLGFLGRDGQGGIRWAERLIVDWASQEAND